MKIAYLIDPIAVATNKSNGIRSQALTWCNGLRALGHTVMEINSWEIYDWTHFDIIHLFGSNGIWFNQFAREVLPYNTNLAFSPICDDVDSIFKQRLKTFIGFKKLQIWSFPFIRKQSYKYFKAIIVRSNYEASYISEAYGVNKNIVYKVPLPYSYNLKPDYDIKKENFCLHISSIYQERKNVIRLIEAAKKYQFKLVLAGSTGSDIDFMRIKCYINENDNIQVLGFITEVQKIELYKKAKVLALPSLKEGVGIVALDAALFGCELVITNIGGPKEYFNGLAQEVDPYSIDEIGKSISRLMKQDNQTKLQKHVFENYSLDSSLNSLMNCYQKILRG